MNVKFPSYKKEWGKQQDSNAPNQWHRYYSIHIQYVLNILKKGGANIKMIPAEKFKDKDIVSFDCVINNHLCRFDFSDHEKLKYHSDKYKAYFKFHYKDSHKEVGDNVFPFSPVNFHDWDLYDQLTNEIKYKCIGKILNNHSPAGAAIERRTYVHKILKSTYGDEVDIDRYSKEDFFRLINNASAIVCVPGARNDMLDRGQGQQMFFGACTISPKLKTRLSYDRKILRGIHYVECKPDYSDLIQKIEWVKENQEHAIQIGKTARKLFLETSTPEKQIEWIKICLDK